MCLVESNHTSSSPFEDPKGIQLFQKLPEGLPKLVSLPPLDADGNILKEIQSFKQHISGDSLNWFQNLLTSNYPHFPTPLSDEQFWTIQNKPDRTNPEVYERMMPDKGCGIISNERTPLPVTSLVAIFSKDVSCSSAICSCNGFYVGEILESTLKTAKVLLYSCENEKFLQTKSVVTVPRRCIIVANFELTKARKLRKPTCDLIQTITKN